MIRFWDLSNCKVVCCEDLFTFDSDSSNSVSGYFKVCELEGIGMIEVEVFVIDAVIELSACNKGSLGRFDKGGE